VIGRRYEDVLGELELLCIRTGRGTLTYLGRNLRAVDSGIPPAGAGRQTTKDLELAQR